MNFAPVNMMNAKTGATQEMCTLAFPAEAFMYNLPVWLAENAQEDNPHHMHEIMRRIADQYYLNTDKCVNPRIVHKDLLAPRFTFDYLGSVRELQNKNVPYERNH